MLYYIIFYYIILDIIFRQYLDIKTMCLLLLSLVPPPFRYMPNPQKKKSKFYENSTNIVTCRYIYNITMYIYISIYIITMYI